MKNDQLDSDSLIGGNKDETEIPIGDVQNVAVRKHAMWRCGECGAMGTLEDMLPETCPECTAPKEELYYREED